MKSTFKDHSREVERERERRRVINTWDRLMKHSFYYFLDFEETTGMLSKSDNNETQK